MDERGDIPEDDVGHGDLEAGDGVDGLGLTDEFSRIEHEIRTEREASESEAEAVAGEAEVSEQPSTTVNQETVEADSLADPDEHDESDDHDDHNEHDDLGALQQPSPEPDQVPEPVATSIPPPAAETPFPGTPSVQPWAGARRAAAGNRLAALAATIPEEELGNKTPRLWMRFVAGSMVVVSSIASAVAIAGLLLVSDIAAGLTPIEEIKDDLEVIAPGDPQTVMIIGSDLRADDERGKKGALSDTTMLLRIDPDKEVLSLFSLPRDLEVDIPGVGVDQKLNQAYANGGIEKTLQTVKAYMDLPINHAVEINFSGFADAVTAIGCVFIDVDREYFNDNSTAAPGEEYAAIDINAGYQRLCGQKALDYVRFRKTDDDLVRAARQQDFLREARARVDKSELIRSAVFGGGTADELIKVFTDNTNSDIEDSTQIIGLLKSFASMADVPVNEVQFEGDLGDATNTNVTTTPQKIQKARDEFLNGVGTPGQRGGDAATEKPAEPKKTEKPKDKKEPKADVLDASSIPTDPNQSRFANQLEQLQADSKKSARRLGIASFYPTKLVPGSEFSTDSRTYEFENEEDKKVSAYKTVIEYGLPSGQTEYYGLTGTVWDDPPILRNPSESMEIGGREYDLFYDGDRLRMVGWREDGNSYWLNNTLSQSIGEREMIAMIESLERTE